MPFAYGGSEKRSFESSVGASQNVCANLHQLPKRGEIMQSSFVGAKAMVVASFALWVPISAFGTETPALLPVKVFADHYAVGDQRFGDVATLEAWLKPMAARTLRLENCGRASAERLVAAVQRFHLLYDEGITVRYLGDGCIAHVAQPRWLDNAVDVSGSPYLAVDADGRGTLP